VVPRPSLRRGSAGAEGIGSCSRLPSSPGIRISTCTLKEDVLNTATPLAATDLVFQTIDWHEADDPELVVTAFTGNRRRRRAPAASSPASCSIDKPGDVQRFSKHVRDTCRTFEGTGAVGKLVQRREFMFYSVGARRSWRSRFPSIAEFTRAQASSCATTV
jgi:hypothetical protein